MTERIDGEAMTSKQCASLWRVANQLMSLYTPEEAPSRHRPREKTTENFLSDFGSTAGYVKPWPAISRTCLSTRHGHA
jgi:hypothetical protein